MRAKRRAQNADRYERAAEFDVGQRLFDRAQTEAAAFLGHAEPQNSELGHFRPERGIGIADLPELVRAQPFERGAGRQKAADHIDNLLLFFGRKQVHDKRPYRGRPSTRSPMMLRWISDVPAAIVLL